MDEITRQRIKKSLLSPITLDEELRVDIDHFLSQRLGLKRVFGRSGNRSCYTWNVYLNEDKNFIEESQRTYDSGGLMTFAISLRGPYITSWGYWTIPNPHRMYTSSKFRLSLNGQIGDIAKALADEVAKDFRLTYVNSDELSQWVLHEKEMHQDAWPTIEELDSVSALSVLFAEYP